MRLARQAAALALSVLSACASVPYGIEPPEVSLADVSFKGGNLFEQRIGLALRITNPNRRALDVEGASFTVELNGKQFARGVSDQPFVVPALGERVVDVSAVTTLHEVLRQIGVAGSATGIEYAIAGKLMLGGYGALPFKRSGRIGLPDAVRGAPPTSF